MSPTAARLGAVLALAGAGAAAVALLSRSSSNDAPGPGAASTAQKAAGARDSTPPSPARKHGLGCDFEPGARFA